MPNKRNKGLTLTNDLKRKENKAMTTKEKKIWNEAVKATLKEVLKFDGIITSLEDRNYIKDEVTKKISYKKLKP